MPVSVGELLAYLRLDSSGFDGKLAGAQGEMRAAAGSADAMTGAVDTSSAALAGAGRSAGVASSGTAKFKAAQLSAVAATERYNKVLADSSASTERLAAAEASVIRANERVAASTRQQSAAVVAAQNANSKAYLDAQLAASKSAAASTAAGAATVESSSRLAGASASLMRSGRMLLGLGAAFGVFELVKKAIDVTKEANEYHRAMVQVQTTTDTTAAEVTKASAALLKMSGDVATAPLDLATAFYHAKSVGLDYAKSLETVKIAAEGAKVGHADVEETMNALTSTVASGIPGVKDMSSAMGQLIATVGAGDMKLEDLNQALGSGVLAVVKGYGLSITDVGAALATFGDNNIRGADAATMLRMAVQSMAVPAKAGRAELDRLGLSATTLRDDMQTGGLNKAILDLKAHLDNAGVGAKQVGGVLTEVFGKRAGPGLSVLIGQVGRLESKFAVLNDAGTSFSDKWKATTQTASYALAKLEAKFQSTAITLTAKLGPSIADAANWLGTTLPHAAKTLIDIVTPLARMVGPILVGAFKLLAGIIRTTIGALSSIGHFLSEHKTLVTSVAAAVLTLWTAYKGFVIAKAALVALDLAMGRLAARAPQIGAAIASSMTTGNLAIAGLTVVLGAAIYEWQKHRNAAAATNAEIKADVDAVTDAIKQDTGAVGENTRAWITNHLQKSGAFDSAAKLGISLATLTDAAEGNAAAIGEVYNAVNNGPKLTLSQYQHLLGGIELSTHAINVGTHAYQQNAEANREAGRAAGASGAIHEYEAGALLKGAQANDKYSTATGKAAAATDQSAKVMQYSITSSGRLVGTMVKAGSQIDNTASAMDRQRIASGLLKNALDALNGVNLSAEQATDQFSIALGGLRDKTALAKDANGHYITSLNQSTAAGATNRQLLVGLIGDAKEQAQATADQARKHHSLADALAIGNHQLKLNEDKIRAAARAAGFDKDETNKLITRLGVLGKIDIKPKVHLTGAEAMAAQVQGLRDLLGHLAAANINIGSSVGANGNIHIVGGGSYAKGGTIPGVGNGDTHPAMLTPGEEVTPKRQAIKYRPLLKAIAADNVHGFAAGGTVGDSGTSRGGALRISGGRMEIDADSQGRLFAMFRDVVLDEHDHRATVSRMGA